MVSHHDLEGSWKSVAPEATPNPDGSITYIVREFSFPGGEDWSMTFTGFGDEQGTFKLFSGRMVGTYQLGEESADVEGATKAVFGFDQKFFTVAFQDIADMFNGGEGDWQVGVEKDITETGCMFVPSVAQAGAEYDIVKIVDGQLFFGDRSTDLFSEANRPTKLIAFPVARS